MDIYSIKKNDIMYPEKFFTGIKNLFYRSV